MIGGQRAPSSVANGDERALALRHERDLDERLLLRLEVDAAPLQLEARGRFPMRHQPDFDRSRPALLLERLEHSSAELGLEEELSSPLPCDAVLRAGAPPEID